MTEIGEGVNVSNDKPESPKKGDLKVIVRDVCNGDGVKDVEVSINKSKGQSNEKGEAIFKSLDEGAENINAKIHFKEADYATFIVHYPRVLSHHEAKSSERDVALIEADKEVVSEIDIKVFKKVGEIVFHRRHIDIGGADKYGHWWTVINSSTSYGWWPKYPLGSPNNYSSKPPIPPTPLPDDPGIAQQIQYKFEKAIYVVKQKSWETRESSPVQTLSGVDGELNGQTSFGGSKTMDPHHIGGDEGNEQYQPVRWDCFILAEIEKNIKNFASSYSGGWSWRFEGGNHCHTFQKILMKNFKLDNVKVLK